MWNALGSCYEHMDQTWQAIKCFKRALIGSDNVEPHALAKLAKLYQHLPGESEKNHQTAAYFYKKYLDDLGDVMYLM